jgi:hypothetical protein
MINVQVNPESIFLYPIGKAFFTPLFNFKASPTVTFDKFANFFQGFINMGFVNIGFENQDTLVRSQKIPPHGLKIAPA